MTAWEIVNFVLWATMFAMMLYQVIFIIVGLFAKKKYPEAKEEHTYGFLIADKNRKKLCFKLFDGKHCKRFSRL